MLRAHLPAPPEWIVVLFYLGFPGLFVAEAFAGYSRVASFTLAILANWVFYFFAFRVIAWWPRFRLWMKHRAEMYVRGSSEKR
jgi:hypothetical protein